MISSPLLEGTDIEIPNTKTQSDDISLKTSITKLSQSKCISSLYANFPIAQKAYKCSSCLGSGFICEYCYNNCHKDCTDSKKASNNIQVFVCECAKRLKHSVSPTKKIKDQEEIEEIKNDDEIGKVLKIFLKNVSYRENDSVIQDLVDHVEETFDNLLRTKFVYYRNCEEMPLAYHTSRYQQFIEEDIDLNDYVQFIQWGIGKNEKSYNLIVLLNYCASMLEIIYLF